MKRGLTSIVLYAIFLFVLIYPIQTLFVNQEPIQISHKLEYLPTDDVQLVLQADNITSFQIPLGDFKNRQFEGISNVEVKEYFSTISISVYATESCLIFHTQLERIETPSWSVWGMPLGSYNIVTQTIDNGVLNLTLHPEMDTLAGFMLIGGIVGILFIAHIVGRMSVSKKHE